MNRTAQGEAIERAMGAQRRSLRQERYLEHRTARLAWAIGHVGSAAVLLAEQADRSTGSQRRVLASHAAELDTLLSTLRADLAPMMTEGD